MKKQRAEVFIADDGTKFHTEDECLAHEARIRAARPETIVAGRTPDELLAAINGGDRPLADAVEALARKVAKGRAERGEWKRPRTAAEPVEEAAAEAEAAE